MHGGGQEAIIALWKDLAGREPQTRRRAEYGGLALVFAGLTEHGLAWQQGLEGWNVQESPIVQQWQAQALAEGLERGRAEGLERGRAEGLERGRAEGLERGRTEGLERGRTEGLEKGLERGRLEERRQALLEVLQARFAGGLPADLLAAVQTQEDVERLAQWLRLASTVASLEHFRASLQS